MEEEIYIAKGYKNREDYLNSLSKEYNIPYFVIKQLADTLGSSEDFDGLINALEDSILQDYYDDYCDDYYEDEDDFYDCLEDDDDISFTNTFDDFNEEDDYDEVQEDEFEDEYSLYDDEYWEDYDE